MLEVSTDTYGELLRTCYVAKSPLYVYGGPGIGKSEIPRQVFTKIAKEQGKEYIDWNELNIAERKKVIANADKYWVFCDKHTVVTWLHSKSSTIRHTYQ